MLVPIIGENGAIIVQYAITLAVVVALIALVVWGIRQYGGGAVRPAVRGRLPRLAIIDTLPVDNKRKLVLLRRDNVEHLILIGGPSDTVVEASIVRQRVGQRTGQATATRPGAAAAAAAVAPGPIAPHLEEDAIPVAPEQPLVRPPVAEPESSASTAAFTTRRVALGSGEQATAERSARPYIPSRRSPVRPTPAASAVGETVRDHRGHAAHGDTPERDFGEEQDSSTPAPRPAYPPRHERAASRFVPAPVADEPSEPPNGPVPGYETVGEDREDDARNTFAPRAYDAEQGAVLEPDESRDERHPMEIPAAPPTSDAEPAEDDDRSDEVNELEQEMARLLGQISTTRQQHN